MTEALLVVVVLVLFARGKKRGGEGRGETTPDGEKRDGGRYWGRGDSGALDDFDFSGNGLYIDTDCQLVAEGRHFFPADWATTNTRAEEAPTLAGTLALGRDNTVMGFLDYLIDTEGVEDPFILSSRILEEASPQCASVPDDQWGAAMRAWYESLVRRVTAYVEQETIG